MYALVEISAKQYKVQEGDTLLVDLQHKAEGEKITFPNVLAVVGDTTKFGAPYVDGASVQGSVVREKVLDDKIRVYKYHRRKAYRRTQGHRQGYTQIKVDKIVC